MTRKKLDLTYISNDTSREVTFEKRKQGVMKKLKDIKDLCNVDACAFIGNPSDSNLDVWPSNPEEVAKVLERFEKSEKKHKLVNLEEFIKHNMAKGETKSEIMMTENNEILMKELMFYLCGNMEGLSMDDNIRGDLCKFIDHYCTILIHHRDVTLKNPNLDVGESSSIAMVENIAPISMDGVMAQTSMAEAGSSSFITTELQALIYSYQRKNHVNPLPNSSLNAPISNFPQPTNNFHSIISSNQIPENVSSLGGNFMNPPNFNFPQPTNELKSMISSYQRSEVNTLLNAPVIKSPLLTNEFQPIISQGPNNILPNSGEEVYIPVSDKDEIDNLHQNQDQQQEFVEAMLKLGERTGFPWMDENNQF